MDLDHRIAIVFAIVLLTLVPSANADTFPTVVYDLGATSTYQEGCFDPCDCLLLEEQPMTGSFEMVFYPFQGPLWTVAIENANWSVPTLDKQITGQGIYRRAGDQQYLQLDLQIDGGEPQSFQSGWVEGGDAYPFVDVTVTLNDFECFDIVLRLHAAPTDESPRLTVDRTQLSWSAVAGASAYDVVCGDLTQLHASGGDFAGSVDLCLADALDDTALPENVIVASGQAVWFLVRTDGGTYDTGDAAQAGSRDEGIASSTVSCP
jgi:hypothetical protein